MFAYSKLLYISLLFATQTQQQSPGNQPGVQGQSQQGPQGGQGIKEPRNADVNENLEIFLTSIVRVNTLCFQFLITSTSVTSVNIEYEPYDGGGPVLKSQTSVMETTHVIDLMRLYPNTRYNFSVYALPQANPRMQDTFETGEIPCDIADRQMEIVIGTPTYDLALASVNNNGRYLYMFDKFGQIVWFTEIGTLPSTDPIYQTEDNTLLVMTNNGFQEYSPLGDLLMDLVLDCHQPHHGLFIENRADVDGSSSQKLWTLGYSSESFQGFEDEQLGDTAIEIDLEKREWNIVLDIFDHIMITERTRDSNGTLGDNIRPFPCNEGNPRYDDWSHGNYIFVNGTVMLMSFRHLDAIVLFGRTSTGWAKRWQLGGSYSDFVFDTRENVFRHQHHAVMLENGNILLFDNGNNRPAAEGGEYSRALEFELDMENRSAKVVWQFRLEIDSHNFRYCYASYGGVVQRLSNGNTMVQFPECDISGTGYTAEVDQSGELVSLIRHNVEHGSMMKVIALETVNGERILEESSRLTHSDEHFPCVETAQNGRPRTGV